MNLFRQKYIRRKGIMNFANVLEKREFKNENVNKVTQMLKKMT